MAYRPNFTALELEDDAVVVHGISDADDPSDLEDIVSINVVLVQGGQVARAAVDEIATAWVARVPFDGDYGGFDKGEATVFGVETRFQHAATITWAQAMEIVAAEA
jgi:hypothetical protein